MAKSQPLVTQLIRTALHWATQIFILHFHFNPMFCILQELFCGILYWHGVKLSFLWGCCRCFMKYWTWKRNSTVQWCPKRPQTSFAFRQLVPTSASTNNSLAVIFRQFILCPLTMLEVAIE